jgi:hypothetical protein
MSTREEAGCRLSILATAASWRLRWYLAQVPREKRELVGVLQAFDLTGKVAVVTGGNMGLGEAFAHALAEAGAYVAIAARTHDRNLSVAGQIQATGAKAVAVDVDRVHQDPDVAGG